MKNITTRFLPSVLFFTLSLGAVLFSACMESAQAQWVPIASLGAGPTDGCFSFTLHGKGYVGGGSNGGSFYEYDTLANTWTLKGDAPGDKIRGFGFSFVINGKGYAGCGDTTGNNNSTADLWMYNDTTNTWTQGASFPGGGRDAMLCFAIGDTAYIGGGFDASGDEWNDFYKYVPATNTWTALSALPTGIGFPASFVINNKGYLATGVVSAEVQSLWEYDPATDTWTAKASFPGTARQAAFGFSLDNDYGYVGGGMAGYEVVYNDMWRYDPTADSWGTVQSFPSSYPAWSCAFTMGNTAFVGTGTYFDTTTETLFGTDSFKKYYGASAPAAIRYLRCFSNKFQATTTSFEYHRQESKCRRKRTSRRD